MHDEIILYAFVTSPFAAKVKCYLDYKQLPFRMEYVDPIHPREVAFTGQRTIPVLKIGEEWRRDSTPIGVWLDEKYPERPLLGSSAADRERILAIDDWITTTLIPAAFVQVAEWDSAAHGIRNGWLLSSALHSTKPMGVAYRWLWPFLIPRALFVRRIVRRHKTKFGPQSRSQMWNQILSGLAEHLGVGPFLGEQDRPTLADLSAYPQFVFPRLLGMHTGADSEIKPPLAVARWLRRMSKELPANPLLVPDHKLKLSGANRSP